VALVVVVGWGSSVGAWSAGAGGDPNWGSLTWGGTDGDYGRSVAVDGSGNVYTIGNFAGTVNFGAGNVTSAGNDEIATANSLKNVLVASYMENTKDLHSWGCTGDVTWAIKESEQLSNFGKDEAGLLAACMESKVGGVLLKSHIKAMAANCVATVMPALSPDRAIQLGTYWHTPEQLWSATEVD